MLISNALFMATQFYDKSDNILNQNIDSEFNFKTICFLIYNLSKDITCISSSAILKHY